MSEFQKQVPHLDRSLILLACLVTLTLAACVGGEDEIEVPAESGAHPAVAAVEKLYQHMSAGDFTAAAQGLSEEGIAQVGGLESAAERLKSSNPAMIHHGGISSMSSTLASLEESGVMVRTTVIFKDGTLDEMEAWMKEYDGVWKMNL